MNKIIAGVLAISLLLLASPVSAAVIYNNTTNTGGSAYEFGKVNQPFGDYYQQGIRFESLSEGSNTWNLNNISGVTFYLCKVGSPSDSVKVWATDAYPGYYSSSIRYESSSISGSSITTDCGNPTEATFTFSTRFSQSDLNFNDLQLILARTSSRSDSDYYKVVRVGSGSVIGQNQSIVRLNAKDITSSSDGSRGGTDQWEPLVKILGGAPFYAQVKNIGNYINLRSGTSTSADIIKTLPGDWIVYVATTTTATDDLITNDGYNWYQIVDPTDNVMGWMAGENASTSVYYLPFESTKQSAFLATSTNYIATSSRPDLILDITDHYYNNTSTSTSLFSSDNGTNNISLLKNQNFEKKVIWGITAQESGGIDFNNEYVSFDYGHGIMQITFSPGSWDNRGVGSDVVIPPCEAVSSSDYLDCYGGTNPKYYKPYGGSGNVTYKQYTNTEQSIYANIKDGLEVLADKLNIYSGISATTTVNGTAYSPTERKIISATESYNGACAYVDNVADRLDEIDSFFPSATSSDITTLVQKMHTAGTEAICAQLHSPGDLSIQNSRNEKIGVIDGKEINNFPLAVNDREHKLLKILSPEKEADYTYKIVGTDSGTYGLDIILKNGDQITKFKASDIAMLPGQIHTYSIDKNKLEDGAEGVTISIDRNGDGTPERVIKSGLNFDSKNYNAEAIPEELEAFSKGDVPNPSVRKNRGAEILLPRSQYTPEIKKWNGEIHRETEEEVLNKLNSGKQDE